MAAYQYIQTETLLSRDLASMTLSSDSSGVTESSGQLSQIGATWLQAYIANSGFGAGAPRSERRKGDREGREPRAAGSGRANRVGNLAVPEAMLRALRKQNGSPKSVFQYGFEFAEQQEQNKNNAGRGPPESVLRNSHSLLEQRLTALRQREQTIVSEVRHIVSSPKSLDYPVLDKALSELLTIKSLLVILQEELYQITGWLRIGELEMDEIRLSESLSKLYGYLSEAHKSRSNLLRMVEALEKWTTRQRQRAKNEEVQASITESRSVSAGNGTTGTQQHGGKDILRRQHFKYQADVEDSGTDGLEQESEPRTKPLVTRAPGLPKMKQIGDGLMREKTFWTPLKLLLAKPKEPRDMRVFLPHLSLSEPSKRFRRRPLDMDYFHCAPQRALLGTGPELRESCHSILGLQTIAEEM